MKKSFIILMMSSCLLLTPSMAQVVVNDPVATSQAVITCGNARFTVLTPEMIRVEYSDQAKFEDRATFTIVNRKLDAPQFTKSEDDTYLYTYIPYSCYQRFSHRTPYLEILKFPNHLGSSSSALLSLPLYIYHGA